MGLGCEIDEDCQTGVCGTDGRCAEPTCGDGRLHPDLGETCDDGNAEAYDGCDRSCQISAICPSAPTWSVRQVYGAPSHWSVEGVALALTPVAGGTAATVLYGKSYLNGSFDESSLIAWRLEGESVGASVVFSDPFYTTDFGVSAAGTASGRVCAVFNRRYDRDFYLSCSDTAWADDLQDTPVYGSSALEEGPDEAMHMAYDGGGRPLSYAGPEGAHELRATLSGQSIAVDLAGGVHIAYVDYATRALRYARRDGAGWTDVEASTVSTTLTSIAVDGGGRVIIAHVGDGTALRISRLSGGSWSHESIPGSVRQPHVRVDENDRVLVGWNDATGGHWVGIWSVAGVAGPVEQLAPASSVSTSPNSADVELDHCGQPVFAWTTASSTSVSLAAPIYGLGGDEGHVE